MSTTIMVKEDLIRVLAKLKKESGAESYDELLRELVKKTKNLEKSHFGTLPKLRSFKREELDRLD
jgi:predicted CopG family antitoxin